MRQAVLGVTVAVSMAAGLSACASSQPLPPAEFLACSLLTKSELAALIPGAVAHSDEVVPYSNECLFVTRSEATSVKVHVGWGIPAVEAFNTLSIRESPVPSATTVAGITAYWWPLPPTFPSVYPIGRPQGELAAVKDDTVVAMFSGSSFSEDRTEPILAKMLANIRSTPKTMW